MSDPYSCIMWILHCLEIAREKNDLLNRFIYAVNINGISAFWIFIVLWSVDLIYLGLLWEDAFILRRCALWNLDLFHSHPWALQSWVRCSGQGCSTLLQFSRSWCQKVEKMNPGLRSWAISFLLFDWNGGHWRIIWIKMWRQNSGPVIVFLGKIIACYHGVIAD